MDFENKDGIVEEVKQVEEITTNDSHNIVIEIKDLTKKYGSKTVVDNISFNVKRGEIVGFLGPNGAGKTTTMNILTGYISSNGGSATVDGMDILEHANEVKKRIGYLPENPPLYLDMTVREYLDFVYDLKKVKEKKVKHINEILEMVNLTDVSGRLIKNLSKGYKQRVGLAQALIGNPEVLVLDEPTIGLDPNQIIEIRKMIKELGKERTIILSTHILPEVSAICDRVIIINKGKIVASDTTDNLSKTASGKGKYIIRIAADEYQVKNALAGIPGLKYLECTGTKEQGSVDFLLEATKDVDIRYDVFNVLSKARYAILMLKPLELTLEEVFIKLTNSEIIDTSAFIPQDAPVEPVTNSAVTPEEEIVEEPAVEQELETKGDEE